MFDFDFFRLINLLKLTGFLGKFPLICMATRRLFNNLVHFWKPRYNDI